MNGLRYQLLQRPATQIWIIYGLAGSSEIIAYPPPAPRLSCTYQR